MKIITVPNSVSKKPYFKKFLKNFEEFSKEYLSTLKKLLCKRHMI